MKNVFIVAGIIAVAASFASFEASAQGRSGGNGGAGASVMSADFQLSMVTLSRKLSQPANTSNGNKTKSGGRVIGQLYWLWSPQPSVRGAENRPVAHVFQRNYW